MSDKSDSDSPVQPTLEEPDTVELPEAGVGTLLGDGIPSMASKLTVLENLTALLTRDLKFQDFIREVLVTIMKAVKSEAGSILEVNYEDRTIFFRAAAGHSSDRVVRFVIPMGQGIVGYVVESQQPLIVADVPENRIHLKAITDAIGFSARNLVAVPIVIRGRVYGVLELLNRVGQDTYTEADVELLRKLCFYAARAIEIRLMITWAQQNSQKNSGPQNNQSGEAA